MLSDNNFFEDGHVLKVEMSPLRIQVGYDVGGNYEANSERIIKTFTLQPDQIKEWTFPSDGEFIPSADHYIESIEPIDVFPGIGLEFSTPLTFRLVTNSITIIESGIIKTIFKPWVSDNEIFVTSSLVDIPRPEYWKDKLSSLGHEIVFRYYGSEVKLPGNLPYPDYSGYYIQVENRVDKNPEGIFIKHISKNGKSISLHFQNKDKQLESIWIDLTRVLSELQDAKVSSGNCKFDGDEWLKYING